MPITALDPTTALVVIDLQKGLAQRPTLRPFQDVVANAARLAQAFRRRRLPVVLVRVAFSADRGDLLATRVEARLALPANIPPEFSELVPELAPEPTDLVITKHQPNAF